MGIESYFLYPKLGFLNEAEIVLVFLFCFVDRKFNCSDLIRGEVKGLISRFQVRNSVDWLEHGASSLPLVELNGWHSSISRK